MRQQVRTGRVQTPNMAELHLDYDAKTRLVSRVGWDGVVPCCGWDRMVPCHGIHSHHSLGCQPGHLAASGGWGDVATSTASGIHAKDRE